MRRFYKNSFFETGTDDFRGLFYTAPKSIRPRSSIEIPTPNEDSRSV